MQLPPMRVEVVRIGPCVGGASGVLLWSPGRAYFKSQLQLVDHEQT